MRELPDRIGTRVARRTGAGPVLVPVRPCPGVRVPVSVSWTPCGPHPGPFPRAVADPSPWAFPGTGGTSGEIRAGANHPGDPIVVISSGRAPPVPDGPYVMGSILFPAPPRRTAASPVWNATVRT
ncbi:hypothetical protein GCM10017559_67650 [Streptosporangium longisporum]|uniref:Uncharacterized protein n=1 Tax=Streptosporangium longisporum TaxID=46187 RepID=A0ABP6L4N6_9ACTN